MNYPRGSYPYEMGRSSGVVSRGVEACPDAILCGRQDGGLGRVNSEQVDRNDVLGCVAPHTLPRTGSRFRARSLVKPRLCFMHTKRLCNCSPNKRRLAGFGFQDCSFEADAGATPPRQRFSLAHVQQSLLGRRQRRIS